MSTVPRIVLLLSFAGMAPAQRLLVSSDSSSGCGAGVRAYDPCTGQSSGFFIGCGTGGVVAARGLAVAPDGNILVANQAGNEIRRFDQNGGALGVFVAAGGGGLNLPWSLAFGPNGNLFASSYGAGPGRVIQYDGSTGAPIGTFAVGSASDIVEGIAFAPNGNLLASSLQANAIREFHGTTGTLLRTITGGLAGPRGMAFGPDGFLYTANANGNSVTRHDFATGAFAGTFVAAGSGGLAAPQELLFSPNGNLLVSSYQGAAIKEYDGATGTWLGNLTAENHPIGLAVDWPRGVGVYGQSTPGCQGRPGIGVNGAPLVGNLGFAITCVEAPLSAPGVLALSGGALATPFVYAGASVWVDLASPLLVLHPAASNANGSASVPLGIPANPTFAGFRFYAQFAWANSCATAGLSATRALSIVVPGLPPSCGSDPYEPNGACAAAASIPPNGSLAAVICPRNDEDWYQFALPGARNVTVTLASPQSPCLDYDLALFSACGSPIASSSLSGCFADTLTANNLAAGTYRIRVSGAAGAWHATATYTLSVQSATLPPIVANVTSGSVTFAGIAATYPTFRQHPNLVHVFTPTVTENVTVTVNASVQQVATCRNPFFYARIAVNNGTFIIGSTSVNQGSSGFGLNGSFTANAGQLYTVMLLVSFDCAGFGGNLGAVPAQGQTATMTVTRTAQ